MILRGYECLLSALEPISSLPLAAQRACTTPSALLFDENPGRVSSFAPRRMPKPTCPVVRTKSQSALTSQAGLVERVGVELLDRRRAKRCEGCERGESTGRSKQSLEPVQ
jgi:hypothetical protein